MPNTDADFYSLEQFAKDIEARREKGRVDAENFRNLMAEVYKERLPVAPVADEPKPLVSPSILDLIKSGAVGTYKTFRDAPETAMAAAGNIEAKKRIIAEQNDEVAPGSWDNVHNVSDFGSFLGSNAAHLVGSAAPLAAAGAAYGALGGPVGAGAGATAGALAGILWGITASSGIGSTREAIKRKGQGNLPVDSDPEWGAIGTGVVSGAANLLTGSVVGRGLNATGLNKVIPSSVSRFMAETPAKMESDVLANAIKRSTLSTAAREGASAGGINAAAAAGTEALMQIQAGEPTNQKAILDAATGAGLLGTGIGSLAGGLGAASHRNAAIAERARRTPPVISALDAEDMRSGMNANAPTGSTGPTIPPSGPPVSSTIPPTGPPVAPAITPVVSPVAPPAPTPGGAHVPVGVPGGAPREAIVRNEVPPSAQAQNWNPETGSFTPAITPDVSNLNFDTTRLPPSIPGGNYVPPLESGPNITFTNAPKGENVVFGADPQKQPIVANESSGAPFTFTDHTVNLIEPGASVVGGVPPISKGAVVSAAEVPVSTPVPTKAGTDTVTPVFNLLTKAGVDTVTPIFNILTAIQEGGGKTPSLAALKKAARENEVNVRENPNGKPITVESILEDFNAHVSNAVGFNPEYASRYTATGTIPTLPPRPTPSAAPTAPPTRTPEQIAKSVEKVQGVLENLKKASKTGENLHSALVDALNNQDLSHEQVAAAFNIAHTLNQVLPGNAKHNIQFVHELFAQPQQAGALAKSGGTMGESVQGSRLAPTAALEGLIKISLEGKHSNYLVETASHEAFHVLQDYFAKHDPKFSRALDNGFKSKDGSGTLTLQEIDPTIIRKLERTKAPDGESYWKNLTDSIGNAKLSPREAQAYAFGALFDAATRGKPMAGVLPVYARFINMVKEFAQRAGNALRGDGFKNASDVMEMGVSGKAKARYDAMESPTKGSNTEFSAQINTPEFQRWFGDSKVVGKDNKPTVVYHGTDANIDTFDVSKGGKASGAKSAEQGIFFTDSPAVASSYASGYNPYKEMPIIKNINKITGGAYEKVNEFLLGKFGKSGLTGGENVIPAFLKLEKPLVVDFFGKEYRERSFDSLLSQAKTQGYDGVIFKNAIDPGYIKGGDIPSNVYVAFRPEQIKSAIGNNGAFDASNARIDMSARKPKPVAAPTAVAQSSATTQASGATQASGPASIGPKRPVPALPGERGIMRQIADKISGQRFKTYTKDLNGGPVEQTFFEALFRNTVNAADPLRKYEASRFNVGKVDARSAWEAWERSSPHGARNDLLIAKGAASIDNATGEIRYGDYAGAKGLGEILHGTATDKIQPLQDYLIALRERDVRAAGGKGMFNLTDAEINSRISGAEPEFVRIASDLDVFNKAQMKFAVDTGLIDQATSDRLNSMFFTPFYRAIEADATKSSGHIIGDEFSKILNPKSSSNAKQPNMSAFQKMQGSDKGVGGLFENLMRNSEAIMNAGLKNDAARLALNMMQEDGLAVKLPPKYPVTKDVIVVRENGKNVKYNIQDPLLYSVFMGAPPAVRGAFHGAMASYGRFLRTSITSTPMFLINSLWKGKLMAYVQEGSKAFTGPITEGTLAAIKKGLMDGASQQAIRANTGYGQGTFGMGSGASHEQLARATRISAGEATFMDKLHQVGGAIEKVNSSVEMAERIRIYEDAVKKGESIPHAAQEAYRMAPYSRRGAGEGMAGELISYLAPIVPFLNAKIQSNFRIWETTPKQKRTFGAYGLPEGMFTRLAVLTAFSTAAAVYSSQDPRWDTITPEEKADKDQIVIPGMPIIAIPRAFEMGIPAGLSVLAFDAIRKDLPPNYAQMLATIYGKTIGGWSDFVPPALKTAGEIAFNHSTFTGRPLESKTSANLPVSERTGPNVTATATALAHATGAIGRAISGAIPGGKELEGISPTIMQHLLENAVGALGAQAMIATDIVLGANGMLKGKPDGAFGSPTSFTQGAIKATQLDRMIKDPIKHRDADTEKFYEIYGNVAESVALLGRMKTTGNTAKYQELIKDPAFMKQHQMGQALKPFATEMTKYNNAIAQVENSKMDSAKMREEILRLQGMRAQLANRAMSLYTQYENSKR